MILHYMELLRKSYGWRARGSVLALGILEGTGECAIEQLYFSAFFNIQKI